MIDICIYSVSKNSDHELTSYRKDNNKMYTKNVLVNVIIKCCGIETYLFAWINHTPVCIMVPRVDLLTSKHAQQRCEIGKDRRLKSTQDTHGLFHHIQVMLVVWRTNTALKHVEVYFEDH